MAAVGINGALHIGLPDIPNMQDRAGAQFQLALGGGQTAQSAPGVDQGDPGETIAQGSGQAGAPVPPGAAPPVQGAGVGEALPTSPGRPVSADPATLSASIGPLPQVTAGTVPPGLSHPPVTGAAAGSFVARQDTGPDAESPVMTAQPGTAGQLPSPPTPGGQIPVMTPQPGMADPGARASLQVMATQPAVSFSAPPTGAVTVAPTGPAIGMPVMPVPVTPNPVMSVTPPLGQPTTPLPPVMTASPDVDRLSPPVAPPAGASSPAIVSAETEVSLMRPAGTTPAAAAANPAADPAGLERPVSAAQPAFAQAAGPDNPAAPAFTQTAQPVPAGMSPTPSLNPMPQAPSGPAAAIASAPSLGPLQPAPTTPPLQAAAAGIDAPRPGTAPAAIGASIAIPQSAAAPALAQPMIRNAVDGLQTTARTDLRPASQMADGVLAVPNYALALPLMPSLQARRPRQSQHLRAYRQPPNPELYWVDAPSTSSARLIAYTDRRPVPLDLAPYVPRLACWRLDDTEALILTSDPADGRNAAVLHGRIMEHPIPLAVLRTGDGFSTWEGSPLWLRMAGIPKPAPLGILLAESAPARVQVMRQDDGFEVTTVRRGAPVHTRILPGSTALLDQIAYGSVEPSSAAVEIRAARALPEPSRWRVQEGWAAFRRLEARLPQAAGASLRHRFAELAGRGRAVLDQVLHGQVNGLDALDGLALAIALDRLPYPQASGALAS